MAGSPRCGLPLKPTADRTQSHAGLGHVQGATAAASAVTLRLLELLLAREAAFQLSELLAHVERNAEVSKAHPCCVDDFEQVVRATLLAHLADSDEVEAERPGDFDPELPRHVRKDSL